MPPLVLIDGANVSYMARSVNAHIDWLKFKDAFPEHTAFRFFTGVPDRSNVSSGLFRLLDWLSHNGFGIVTKQLSEHKGLRKANMDVEITIEAMRYLDICKDGRNGELVIMSGDGDFTSLLREARNRFVRTCVIAIKDGENACSVSLRQHADTFIEFTELKCLNDSVRPDDAREEVYEEGEGPAEEG